MQVRLLLTAILENKANKEIKMSLWRVYYVLDGEAGSFFVVAETKAEAERIAFSEFDEEDFVILISVQFEQAYSN